MDAKQFQIVALELLRSESKSEESELYGPERTIQYLQNLGLENLSLIFEYAKWVLAENLEMGIQIFATNDAEPVKRLDREKVLSFLTKECVAGIIPYLVRTCEKEYQNPWKDLPHVASL